MTARRILTPIACFSAVLVVASLSLRGHADAPAGHYVVADGTVLDTKTGLMWQQGQFGGLGSCDTLELGGYDDWRVPSLKELLTIVDETRVSPAMDPVFSYTVGVDLYATSTGRVDSPGSGWVVYMNQGTNQSQTWYALRCVR
jgi:Protein of unknown function (DUF1566)